MAILLTALLINTASDDLASATLPGADGASTPPTTSPLASASPSASPSPSVPAGKARPGGSGAKLRDVDGGLKYYGKFSPALPTSPSFFPIAVWFESVVSRDDTAKDKAAGINTYVELTDTSKASIIRDAGMYAIASTVGSPGSETVGWLLSDEVDMWGGPGNGQWTGKFPGGGEICSGGDCGYTIQQHFADRLPNDNRLRYANYGKGIAFWESDSQAGKFVNKYQDVISADTYWFTDMNICGFSEGGTFYGGGQVPSDRCHLASNYGDTVSKVRSLVKPARSKPVWGFVELGHPFTENHWPSAQPQQVVAGVWSSIIHGARGIIYFNHSFGGDCITQHLLRDRCYTDMRATVTKLNGRIKKLAPVLNAPFADGVLKTSKGVDATVKWYDGNFYVVAGAAQPGKTKATFTMTCAGDATVTVLDENRTLSAKKGVFTDSFANSNAVHIYRVNGGSSCGAY